MAEKADNPNPPASPGLTVADASAQLLALFPDDPSDKNPPAEPEPSDDDTPPTGDPSDVQTPSDDAAIPPDDEAGDDAPPEPSDEDDEAPEEPELYTVPGTDLEVTLEEALKGYRRQSDYSRKTQELAAQRAHLDRDREAFETERTTLESDRTAYRQTRDKYNEALEKVTTYLDTFEQEPDWTELQERDPDAVPAAMAQWRKREKQIAKLKAEREQIAEERGKEQLAEMERHVTAEAKLLREKIPEFANKDPAVAGKFKADLVAYGLTQGFTEQEITNWPDHRALVVLRKAMAYDQIQSKKDVTIPKPGNVPTVKPGATPPSTKSSRATKAQRELRERARQTGRVADAAAALLDLPDD